MVFWNRHFTKRPENGARPDQQRGAWLPPKPWSRILVPAIGRPYSMRGLEIACRLAQTSGAVLNLTYIMEVPRSFALDEILPDAESLAAEVLKGGTEAAQQHRIVVESSVYRTRDARDGILKLIKLENIDLLVLGARPDEVRGMPRDLSRSLYESATCEVVVDYIAGEQ